MESELREDLLVGWHYSYSDDNWVTPVRECLEGLSDNQARKRLAPFEHTVWEIALHLAVWNENIVERMTTGEKEAHPPEGSWPEVGCDWEADKQRLYRSFDEVRINLQSLSEESIRRNAYGLPDLFCRFTHNGYHLGQLWMMRQLLEYSEEQASC